MLKLYLDDDYLGAKGLCCAITLLNHLPLLQHLSLCNSGMYAAGSMQGAITGNSCIDLLCRELEVHMSIQSLDLRGNDIGTVGAKRLLALLDANSRITALDVGGNNIDERMQGRIVKQLGRNASGVNTKGVRRTVPWVDPLAGELGVEPRAGDVALNGPALCPELKAAVAGELCRTCFVSKADSYDSLVVVAGGSVSVTLSEPNRGSAGTKVSVHTYGPGSLLPYLSTLEASSSPAALFAHDFPKPDQWRQHNVDECRLLDLVKKWLGVNVVSIMQDRKAVLYAVHREARERVAKLLAERLVAMLPCLSRVAWMQVLPWSWLLRLCDASSVVRFGAGYRLGPEEFKASTLFIISGTAHTPGHPSLSELDTLGLNSTPDSPASYTCTTPLSAVCVPTTILRDAISTFSLSTVVSETIRNP